MPGDRGIEVFKVLCWQSPEAAARTLSAMGTDDALRFLDVVDDLYLSAVLNRMSAADVDRMLDRMTGHHARAALEEHAEWAAGMLMIEMDRPRSEMTIGRIGADGLAAVLRKARPSSLADLIAAMDHDEAAGWLARLEPGHAAYVLRHVDRRRVAALIRSLLQNQSAPWLGRLTADEGAGLLEHVDPREAAALIGSLEQQHAADCLTKMPISGAARVLAASVNATGPAQAAGVVRQMDPGQAADVLGAMKPEQYVPVLKQGGPELLIALVTADERTRSGTTVAMIASALSSESGDVARMLTLNSEGTSAKVVGALPVQAAADALAWIDVNQARQVLNAVREFDANRADRLAEMLGLAAPRDRGSGNAGGDAGH